MRSWTYGEIKNKVEADLDLQEEIFITPAELLGYCNEAIDDCEAEIHKLGAEDEYFLEPIDITLTAGQQLVDLPADIYAAKIRGVIYTNGGEVYQLKRLRGKDKFYEMALAQAGDYYRYQIINTSASGLQMMLFPANRAAGATLTVWHIRNAKRLVADTDTCDIPEFVNYIIQHMKVRCYEKEGHPNADMAMGALALQKKLMVETLTEMVPDDDNAIIMDMSHYDDMN